MRYLCCLSERISILIGQNAGGKTLILQASSPAVSDTLFDSSQAQRLQNQSVYAEDVCRFTLYRSFLSLCYRRSSHTTTINPADITCYHTIRGYRPLSMNIPIVQDHRLVSHLMWISSSHVRAPDSRYHLLV